MSVMLVLAALPTWSIGLLVALFFFVCILLILTILIQRPQGGGLSGAFGSGAGSGQTAFGAKTGDALTIATIGMFVVYVLAAIGLNYAIRPSEAIAEDQATAASTPATTGGEGAAPATTTVPPATPAPPGATPESPGPVVLPAPAALPIQTPVETPVQPASEPPANTPPTEVPAMPEPAPATTPSPAPAEPPKPE